MSFINPISREINCKIVYYGCGLGGKTTNLQWIYKNTAGQSAEPMISLTTEEDRTLFFDFVPLEIGKIRGYHLRFHLYTVCGQVRYEPTRKLVLRGVDGLIFVADSQAGRMDDNLGALRELESNLSELGRDPARVPLVFQLNKRDLEDAVSTEEMKNLLVRAEEEVFEAIASEGAGVFETLRGIGKLVLEEVKQSLMPVSKG
ncbi:MAG: GTP-binding protein [Terriglobia bacterium]